MPLRHDRRSTPAPHRADRSQSGRAVAALVLLGLVAGGWSQVPALVGVELSGATITGIGNVLQASIAVAATVVMLLGARRRSGRERAGWSVLAVGASVWACANITWAVRSDLHVPGYDTVETLYLVSFVVTITGLVLLPPAVNRSGRIRHLDAAIMMVAAIALLWSLPMHAEIAQTSGSPGVASLDLYALVEMALLVIAVGTLSRCLPDRNGEIRAFVASVVCLGLADLVWAWSGATGDGVLARVADALYAVVAALMLIAARRLDRAGTTEREPQRRRSDRVPTTSRLALPELASVVALLAILVHERIYDHAPWVAALLSSTLIVLAIVRLGVLSVEQRSLTSSLRRSISQLHTEARTDALTGTGNRIALDERLSTALEMSDRGAVGTVSVVVLDLDRFKRVNDALGHQVGDGLLVELTRRLREHLDAHVYRTGGDEFVAVLVDVQPTTVKAMVDSALVAAHRPVEVGDHELVATVSAGVADTDVLGRTDARALLRAADLALYRAKSSARGTAVVYDDELQRRADHLDELAVGLAAAGGRDELEVRFEPSVDLATREVVGATLGLWWDSPEHGLLRPDQVELIARDASLLGRMLQVRFAELHHRLRELELGSDELWLGVHLTAEELVHPALAGLVLDAVGVGDRARLHVHVDESTISRGAAWEAVVAMHQLGLTVVIERFGTGPSSLRRLSHYPASGLRLDASFVHGLGRRLDDTVVVEVVADLAHQLGLDLYAEGLEEDAQRVALVRLGFAMGRGPLFGGPRSWSELRACRAGGLQEDVACPR